MVSIIGANTYTFDIHQIQAPIRDVDPEPELKGLWTGKHKKWYQA